MTSEALLEALRLMIDSPIPLPGAGSTPLRHRELMEYGRRDMSLARLAEAHFDAVAILAEAGREPEPGALYAVWASEKPGMALKVCGEGGRRFIQGTKMYCSGAGIVDRTLLTVGSLEPLLIDIDLRRNPEAFSVDDSAWKTTAFSETKTATVTFDRLPFSSTDILVAPGWYLERPGFWHGACGPAACWAGGAAGLVEFAREQSRNDPHTLAHLGAMDALVWAMESFLEAAGREIDESPCDGMAAHLRALRVRHLVEQACTEVLCRLPRAYGPYPLAFEGAISQRYHELDLYLRQCHAERDLEALGTLLMTRDSLPGQ